MQYLKSHKEPQAEERHGAWPSNEEYQAIGHTPPQGVYTE